MKKRNPIAVFLFGLITLGIYSWYWAVKTKGEMNRLGEKIPTAWIWLIPIIGSIWWWWKYSEAVEHITQKEMGGVLAFVVLFLLGGIGQAIIQDAFNKINEQLIKEPASSNQDQPRDLNNDTPVASRPTIITPKQPPIVGS